VEYSVKIFVNDIFDAAAQSFRISSAAVEIPRSRIRKKNGLEYFQNLMEYIAGI
jgi:hypothetical protein